MSDRFKKSIRHQYPRPTTNAQGLWSGSLLHAINADLTGSNNITASVWTGTTPSGVGQSGDSLGDTSTAPGVTAATTSFWIDTNVVTPSATPAPFYGISQDLVVPSTIPEPSSWLLLGIGLGVTTVIGWSRRRRAQRRAVMQPTRPQSPQDASGPLDGRFRRPNAPETLLRAGKSSFAWRSLLR